jgi:hypothetical protein
LAGVKEIVRLPLAIFGCLNKKLRYFSGQFYQSFWLKKLLILPTMSIFSSCVSVVMVLFFSLESDGGVLVGVP